MHSNRERERWWQAGTQAGKQRYRGIDIDTETCRQRQEIKDKNKERENKNLIGFLRKSKMRYLKELFYPQQEKGNTN